MGWDSKLTEFFGNIKLQIALNSKTEIQGVSLKVKNINHRILMRHSRGNGNPGSTGSA
jgi:hypothetical protein